nr:hypothetical protein [Morchella crassipes]
MIKMTPPPFDERGEGWGGGGGMKGGAWEREPAASPPTDPLFPEIRENMGCRGGVASVHLSQRDGCIRALRAWTLGRGGVHRLCRCTPPPQISPPSEMGGRRGAALVFSAAPLSLSFSFPPPSLPPLGPLPHANPRRKSGLCKRGSGGEGAGAGRNLFSPPLFSKLWLNCG